MYSATEITYVIKGRILNKPFEAKGHKVREGLFQVQVDTANKTVLAGLKEAPDAFTALWSAIAEWDASV